MRHIELIVEYVLVVNEEVLPEDLVEALKPMGTEAQEIPKSYGLRMLEQGRRESAREIARKLLADGMEPTKVAETTGLPLEEVEKLVH